MESDAIGEMELTSQGAGTYWYYTMYISLINLILFDKNNNNNNDNNNNDNNIDNNNNIYNTQMVAVALGPWASHSEDRAEP